MSHTKGPWGFNVAKNGTIRGLPVIRIFSDTAQDMVLDFAHANGDQDIANARLIASAPEMHQVLMSLALLVEDYKKSGGSDFAAWGRIPSEDVLLLMAAVRAVLKKAEGR